MVVFRMHNHAGTQSCVNELNIQLGHVVSLQTISMSHLLIFSSFVSLSGLVVLFEDAYCSHVSSYRSHFGEVGVPILTAFTHVMSQYQIIRAH